MSVICRRRDSRQDTYSPCQSKSTRAVVSQSSCSNGFQMINQMYRNCEGKGSSWERLVEENVDAECTDSEISNRKWK